METQPPLQQQYDYQYQNQPQIDPNQTTQPYDPSYTSQIQSYDPQSYYASYPQHYDTTQQPYQNNLDSTATTYTAASASYYYPDYSASSYQTSDPNSIHPPGVPVSADTQQIPPPISHNYYYQPPQNHAYFQPGQPVYGAAGSQGGRSTRGGGRGSFGRGRGRGGGRGKHVSAQATNTADASYVQGQAAPSKPPPQMAWCELCRVDCNTLEILEKHKNGKRHLRNLKVFEEMQNLSKQLTVQNQPEGIAEAQMSDMADKTVQFSEEAVILDSSGGRGGLKRKMRGGRGAKWFRTPDGIRRLVDPPMPKKPIVHLLCDICNVKCESPVVYETHLAGKKHLANLKRYQGHKEVFGEAVEALYPTIPNLPPTTIIPQPNQPVEGPQDAQTLAAVMLSNQNLPDPEAAQAALAQLLTQHGVHDAQTLLVQLIPYLLAQSQVRGSEPLPEAGLETNATSLQCEGPHVSSEVADQSDGQNGQVTAEQKNLSGNDGSEAAVGPSDKPDDASSEAVKVGAE